jgi:hypothetical protein
MTLNADEFKVEDRQTWLGYGHLQDYLPDVKIPTTTP